MNQEAVVVVSGLPRSGTSMMMQMIEAGGMEILTDRLRKPDDDNLKGYYELEGVKRLDKDQTCLDEARGKAVKVISELLKYLPVKHHYKVVFLRRKMEEILASQRQMLIRRGKPIDPKADEGLSELFQRSLKHVEEWLERQPNIDVIYIDYNATMQNPRENAEKINRFLNGILDVEKMAKVADNRLYRQRL